MGARNQLGSLTRAALFTHIAILTITFSPIHQWVLLFFFKLNTKKQGSNQAKRKQKHPSQAGLVSQASKASASGKQMQEESVLQQAPQEGPNWETESRVTSVLRAQTGFHTDNWSYIEDLLFGLQRQLSFYCFHGAFNSISRSHFWPPYPPALTRTYHHTDTDTQRKKSEQEEYIHTLRAYAKIHII